MTVNLDPSSLVAFPLLPIRFDAEGRASCACAKGPKCNRIGKHAAVNWGDLKLGDPVGPVREGGGVAAKTGAAPSGSGFIAVDIDGPKALAAWLERSPPPNTYTVKTGRREGGFQFYFRHPGFRVRNSVGDLAPGIDVRGDGGITVLPGSPHHAGPDARYETLLDAPLADCPPWLLEWLRKHSEGAGEVREYDGDVTDGAELERRCGIYAEFLKTTPKIRCEANRGRGDAVVFDVVAYGARDLALPVEEVTELIREHYEPRCDRQWGDGLEAMVAHKCDFAKTKMHRDARPPRTAEEEALVQDILRKAAPPDFTKIITQVAAPQTGNEAGIPTPEPDAVDPLDGGFEVRWTNWGTYPPPLSFLVDNLLVENSVNMIFAEPGSIKSWTAISLANAVAMGNPWLCERAVKQGKALYIDFEDGEREFQRRQYLLGKGDNPEGQLGYTQPSGKLDDKFWEKVATIQVRRGVRFLVIDTLAAATPGNDENDKNAADPLYLAGKFVRAAEKLGRSITVLILHHANRSGEIRGTSAFKGAVDTLFKLETINNGEDGEAITAKLTCIKSGQQKVYPIHLEFDDAGLRMIEAPAKESKGDSEKGEKRTMEELTREVLLLIEQRGPVRTMEMIRVHVKAKNTLVTAAVKELEASGAIFKGPDGYQADNEALSKARVLHAVETVKPFTAGALAKAAHVQEGFVQKLLESKVIAPRASGKSLGFIVLPSQ